jgi:hypothetical protein
MNFEDFPTLSRKRPARYAEVIADAPPEPIEEIVIPELAKLTLGDLNLKSELLTQYNSARQLLHDASYNPATPLNQKAQVINSATSILGQLTKSEAELHSVEEVKKVEAVLITTLKLFPELQEEFLKQYALASEAYSV